MSYSIEGKIVNQDIVLRLSGKVVCGKCCRSIDLPANIVINSKNTSQMFFCKSYIGTPHYIYETKSGTAVVYCSEYCRNKHNHRFSK